MLNDARAPGIVWPFGRFAGMPTDGMLTVMGSGAVQSLYRAKAPVAKLANETVINRRLMHAMHVLKIEACIVDRFTV
jgi:hypothetical protein